MIIFAGAYHLRKHFDNDMDGDILFAYSSTGYSNDKLGLVYLKYFNKFTESSTRDRDYVNPACRSLLCRFSLLYLVRNLFSWGQAPKPPGSLRSN
jgi:hypothetical protein